MKANIRRFLCGLLGGGLLSTALPMLEAQALSQEDLFEKLAAVSVFVVTNREGAFITRQGDFPADGLGNIELLEVFLDESDAQAFASRLVENDPSLRGNGAIGLTNIATVYDFVAQEASLPRKLSLLPNAEELRAAVEINPSFLDGEVAPPPVPIFTIQDAEGSFIPLSFGDSTEGSYVMFMASADAKSILDELNTQKPELEAQLVVYSLQKFSKVLLASDNPGYEQIEFFQAETVLNQNLNQESAPEQ